VLERERNETDQVGVARCIRTKENPALANRHRARDECQHLGGGTALLQHPRTARMAGRHPKMARLLAPGKSRWRQSLAHAGHPATTRILGDGSIETTYTLNPPVA